MKLNDKLCVYILIILASLITLRPALTDDTKPELMVYTYDSFAADWGPGPQIKTAFEQECDCVLTFVGIDTSLGILGRVRLEGENSKACKAVAKAAYTQICQHAKATPTSSTNTASVTARLRAKTAASTYCTQVVFTS